MTGCPPRGRGLDRRTRQAGGQFCFLQGHRQRLWRQLPITGACCGRNGVAPALHCLSLLWLSPAPGKLVQPGLWLGQQGLLSGFLPLSLRWTLGITHAPGRLCLELARPPPAPHSGHVILQEAGSSPWSVNPTLETRGACLQLPTKLEPGRHSRL